MSPNFWGCRCCGCSGDPDICSMSNCDVSETEWVVSDGFDSFQNVRWSASIFGLYSIEGTWEQDASNGADSPSVKFNGEYSIDTSGTTGSLTVIECLLFEESFTPTLDEPISTIQVCANAYGKQRFTAENGTKTTYPIIPAIIIKQDGKLFINTGSPTTLDYRCFSQWTKTLHASDFQRLIVGESDTSFTSEQPDFYWPGEDMQLGLGLFHQVNISESVSSNFKSLVAAAHFDNLCLSVNRTTTPSLYPCLTGSSNVTDSGSQTLTYGGGSISVLSDSDLGNPSPSIRMNVSLDNGQSVAAFIPQTEAVSFPTGYSAESIYSCASFSSSLPLTTTTMDFHAAVVQDGTLYAWPKQSWQTYPQTSSVSKEKWRGIAASHSIPSRPNWPGWVDADTFGVPSTCYEVTGIDASGLTFNTGNNPVMRWGNSDATPGYLVVFHDQSSPQNLIVLSDNQQVNLVTDDQSQCTFDDCSPQQVVPREITVVVSGVNGFGSWVDVDGTYVFPGPLGYNPDAIGVGAVCNSCFRFTDDGDDCYILVERRTSVWAVILNSYLTFSRTKIESESSTDSGCSTGPITVYSVSGRTITVEVDWL